jgi:tetratricopeptide (TPR) repeat protein
MLALRPPSSIFERHRADLLAARGRWAAADSVLRAAEARLADAQLPAHRALLAVLAADLSAGADGSGLHGRFGRSDGPTWGETPILRAFVAGLVASATGDASGVAARAAELDRAAESPLAGDLALTLRADALRRTNRSDEAFRLVSQAGMAASWDYAFNSPFHSRAYTRWLRAELHRERGEDAFALSLYTTLGQVSPFEIAFVAPAYLRRAGIHDRRGERAEALRLYRRFTEMWSDAEPDHRPLLEHAHERIRALR